MGNSNQKRMNNVFIVLEQLRKENNEGIRKLEESQKKTKERIDELQKKLEEKFKKLNEIQRENEEKQKRENVIIDHIISLFDQAEVKKDWSDVQSAFGGHFLTLLDNESFRKRLEDRLKETHYELEYEFKEGKVHRIKLNGYEKT